MSDDGLDSLRAACAKWPLHWQESMVRAMETKTMTTKIQDEDCYKTGERVWCNQGLEVVSGTDNATGRPLVVIAIKHEEKIYTAAFTPDLCMAVIGELTEKYFKCAEATRIFEESKR